MYSIGINIGTTNVKTVVIDKSGDIIANATRKNHTFFYPNNEIEQDPGQWWNNVLDNLKSIGSRDNSILKKVEVIGVCSQGCGVVPVDKYGNILNNAVIYSDNRAFLEANIINKKFRYKIRENCFCNTTEAGNPFSIILWFKLNRNEIYNKTYKFLSVSGYINYKLTGMFTINHSEAGMSNLFDNNNKKWDKNILSEIEIDINKLPSVKECDEIIGNIREDISNITGLNPYSRIIAGGEDTSADALCLGTENSKKCYYFMGTSSNFGICVSKNDIKIIDNTIIIPHVLRELYLINSTTLSTGSSFEWFINKFFINKSEQIAFFSKNEKEINERISYLIFQPYLSEFTSSFDSKNTPGGIIFGLNLKKDIIDLVKMIYEGCSYALMENIKNYEANGLKIGDIFIMGGPTINIPWCQTISDISGRKVIINNSVCSAFGIALLAGSRIGFEMESIIKHMRIYEKELYPREEYCNKYKKIYGIYEKLNKSNGFLYSKLRRVYDSSI